jgi:hypothetical protein
MAVYDWDNETNYIVPDSCDFGISYNTLVHTSPLSRVSQTLQLPGARWSTRLSFKNLSEDESRVLMAFLTKLHGANGRFYAYDFGRPVPRGTMDTQTVEVSSVINRNRIYIQPVGGGAMPNGGVFAVGDYITIGNDTNREMKMVVEAFSGNQYNIEPGLRNYGQFDYIGEPITYKPATCVFMLSSDDQAFWSTRSQAKIVDIDISAIEIILPAGA